MYRLRPFSMRTSNLVPNDKTLQCYNTCVNSQLLELPSELLYLILEYIAYPDALVLKHVHPRFRELVMPLLTVASRVEWLIERADLGLPVPRWIKLNLRHDKGFISNPEVRAMLQKRRKHDDCRVLANRQVLDDYMKTFDGRTEPQSTSLTATETKLPRLRCSLNPNARECPGLARSLDQDNSWQMFASKSPALGRVHNCQPRQTPTEAGIRRLYTCFSTFTRLVGSGVSYLSRFLPTNMFTVWMMVEALIIAAILAHLLFDLEYSQMMAPVTRFVKDMKLTDVAKIIEA